MGKTRVEKALDILQQEIVLWRAEGTGEVFADLPGMRFYPVGDPRFYQWGLRLVWERSGDGTVLRRDEWQTVVDNLRARVSDTAFPVFVRVGGVPGAVFWDLGEGLPVVRITGNGWDLVDKPEALPVRFRRSAYMHPLPVPDSDAKPEDVFLIRELLNLSGEEEEKVKESLLLLVGWLLGTLNPFGSYPVLLLKGEKGSGKTTAARILKGLVDPHQVLSMAPSRDMKDLMVAAYWSHLVVMDNVSVFSQEFADALCRMATGEALYLRKLYTDYSEEVVVYRRPLVITSVVDPMTQPDLIDRALSVELYRVPDTDRKPEEDLYARLTELRPRIMGALAHLVSHALKETTEPQFLPRMADFARFVWRGLKALNLGDAFLSAYEKSRGMMELSAVFDDVAMSVLVAYIQEKGSFSGTAQELLTELEGFAGYTRQKPRGWPGSPVALGHRLARFKASMAALGITVNYHRTRDGNIWTLGLGHGQSPYLEGFDRTDSHSNPQAGGVALPYGQTHLREQDDEAVILLPREKGQLRAGLV
ncbi:hypothetical protein [Thermus scotoductus]|uniref:hypothetical protein n=1 Tax=Thermus scotoductus TaxID=37636 RepID=UPI0003A3596D|nr:hypothetical protein [Thermus scotoductus]